MKSRQTGEGLSEIRTEFESSVLSLAAVAGDSNRILVGLNSGEVEEWDMGCGDNARAIRSRDSVIEGPFDSHPID